MVSLFFPVHAAEEKAATPRLEKFFKQPQVGSAVLSPNQEQIAVTSAINGRLNLVVVDLETRKVTHLAGFTDADVCRIHWISNDRMVFDLIDRDSRDSTACGNGLFAINRDGSKMVELASTIRKQEDLNRMSAHMGASFTWTFKHLSFFDSFRDGSDDIIVQQIISGNKRDNGLYRMNTLTGRKTEFSYGISGIPDGFVTDNKQQLRVIIAGEGGGKPNVIWYRDDTASPWKKLNELKALDPEFFIQGFDADNKTMYVSSRAGGDKWGIYKFDFEHNKVGEKVIDDASVDVNGHMIFDRESNKLLGIRIDGEPPHMHWIDQDFAAAQDEIDAVYPDRVNLLVGNPKKRILVYSYSATHTGEYFIYDPVKKKLEHLLSTMPWISADQMSDQLIFDYAARDGLHIPAYLTIPKGKALKALPMVVYVHGGPYARDHYGFDPTVQFLADLGYAVLQPQYRGSTGYGNNHFKKGWKTWGLAMQDDITDGVRNLIGQGIVDPKRVCVMGASYGGYATLMGLIKEPELFRCGVDLFGVTDINLLFTHGRWSTDDAAIYGNKAEIGDPEKMEEQFKATSPDLHADKILAPVFMAYGGKDTRVPLIHGERMRDALKSNGKKVEWMEFPEEEHGFTKEENRYKVYGAIEKFLKTYNPAD